MPARRGPCRPFFSLAALMMGAMLVLVLAACGGGGGSGGAGGGTPGGGGGGGSGGSTPAFKAFVNTEWRTSNSQVAVDAQGGRHVAFRFYEAAQEGRPTGAAYRYCAAQCELPASWQELRFGAGAASVQLKLTPQGQPRLLIAIASEVYSGGNDYYYAACDSACGQPAQWTATRVFSGRVPASNLDNDDELPQRSFALDPQGRPRFVVFDENQLVTPMHAGLYYLACDDHCDDASRWHETLLTVATPYEVERVAQPALAFSPDGRPRVTSAQFFPLGSRPAVLVYLACDAQCDQTASWGRAELMERGGGAEPSADIAIDPQGRPRIAFYQEAMLGGQGKRLFYLSCDAGCLDATRWQALDLGLGTLNGQEPDLEIDAQGRPRIAYADWDRGGIGYAACDSGCSTDAARWQHRVLEDRDALYAAWPVAFPTNCTGGLWNTLTPSLSLAAGGTPHIAIDATYYARCLYDHNPNDNVPPTAEMNLVMRSVRVLSVD